MSQRQSIRGMYDVLPQDTALLGVLEALIEKTFAAYQFAEIRTPIVEHTDVFVRTMGESTDVVEKEMYTFEDRNGDSLTLRPEGTAGVVRAAIQHGLLNPPGQKVWYHGPMFRHERPQRGRQRQFHQYGVEVFGLGEPAADVELIVMIERLWAELGLADSVELQINSLGDKEDRQRYRQSLVDYLKPLVAQLDTDSQRRLESNPLRIFDSKVPATQEIMKQAPLFCDALGSEAAAHFEQVQSMLSDLGIRFTVNSGLVRGLDYYCRTVFEWVTTDLGSQGTICAGGRYDGLVALAGGKDVPGIGLAMGVERVFELAKQANLTQMGRSCVYFVGQVPTVVLMQHAESLRGQYPDWAVGVDLSGGSLKSQFKRADRSGARFAVIFGEAEYATGHVQVKDLRSDQAQVSVSQSDLAQYLLNAFNSG